MEFTFLHHQFTEAGPQPTTYPPQSQPQPGYPLQPDYTPQPGYPPQEGYPLQQTVAGYPTKEAWQAPPQAPPGGYPPQQ